MPMRNPTPRIGKLPRTNDCSAERGQVPGLVSVSMKCEITSGRIGAHQHLSAIWRLVKTTTGLINVVEPT